MAEPVTAEMLRAKVPPGGVDPDVKIPRHAAEAGRRSEELQRQMLGAAEPSVASIVEGTPTPETPPAHPPETPPAHPPETPPATPPETPPEPPPGDEASLETKYNRLRGQHSADTKRHRETVQTLSDRIGVLEAENRRLQASLAPPATPPDQAQTLLTEQEVQDYGPEMIDVMRRVSSEIAAPLQDEITRLRQQLGHVQEETGNVFLTRMNATIGGLVPNWAELNKSPKFIEWSMLPDVFSGGIRKTLMQEAWNSGDANRVAAFFRAFLAEEAATNPPGDLGQRSPATPTAPAPLAPPAPSLDLASLAAPGRAHSAGGAPAEKPTYTAASITRFYTDCAAGRYRGREQLQAAIDADIILAQHEGRILPDNRTVQPRNTYQR